MSRGVPEPEHFRLRARAKSRSSKVSRAVRAAAGRGGPTLPVELAIFEDVLDPAVLEAAARRAERLGVGGDEVLRCAGILTPYQIEMGVAAALGVSIDPLTQPFEPRSLASACAGALLRDDGERRSITIAARGTGIRWLAEKIARDPEARVGLRIAAPERFGEHVRDVARDLLAHEAVHGLRERRPDLSAAARGLMPLHALGLTFAAGFLTSALLAPTELLLALEYFLAASFAAWILLRVGACLMPHQTQETARIPDRRLPIYTIVVPLYREAAVAAKLVEALKRLHYPREKLDIKLVLEEDDRDTRAAVAALKLHAPFEIIAPPRDGPQTKPRALAAALPFARGSFLTVYDAEDEPEPDQLHRALAAFVAGPPELACVQAKLAIDNPADSWFSRHFAAEYAGQFDVLLPTLARLGFPLPLGGTSNHFRTAVLREVGGWDPFNVTEDADLGMRLARFGYRTGTVDSATWEEAPVSHRQWVRQRTRWMKGWMQTWIVHMRHPLRVWHELGTRGFFALQLLIGGSLLSALMHPIFMVIVVDDLLGGELLSQAASPEHALRKALAIFVLAGGYVSSFALAFTGLRRRNLRGLAWVLLTLPVYWLLLSGAAWRALWQLFFARYRWEKTEHGLARTSLRGPKKNGEVPEETPPRVRDFARNRRWL